MKLEETIRKRVSALIRKAKALSVEMDNREFGFDYGSHSENMYHDTAIELYMGTLGLLEILYGLNSNQVAELKQENKRITSLRYRQDIMDQKLLQAILGILHNLKSEIALGLVTSIYKQASSEVITDFLMLAKEAKQDGLLNVSAVLACAALEDGLKKIAELNGLKVAGNGMMQSLNSLKSNGLIKKDQYQILQSYVHLRNKAFHADWDSIDDADVGGIIGFTEIFISKHFN